jgi:hypothetical protein
VLVGWLVGYKEGDPEHTWRGEGELLRGDSLFCFVSFR